MITMMIIITELITTIKTIIPAIMITMLTIILFNNNTITKQMPFSNKLYQPKMDLIENKHLSGLLMPRPGSLHVTLYNIV